ncbi:ATP phosphoribosyltransferase regulatory subunit [Slackia heliotrinireducens]|uniref:Multifunctional fusion protein n=1 Tax=Slackia heliotrinireducens (strain ATCC 29202 / DSM 20476 / NCTC 11029 / RHS 1) TaxID=471855 RepID=C7N6L4_SLAHD|nr:ATP phosphoribosyltransferase [Slackia heliotrinireducens]ACV22549.1 ATP phosphoribosyltransferase [Slackia heliotrinireducens DSM 20476]VEH01013.1 ATP phosphoribosyltransferase regulatory subunit [Slackia heliotrinireducens]
MIPVTPRGFRDILPEEALKREEITDKVKACFSAHGYLPVETPLLEDRHSMERATAVEDTPFQMFDDGGRLLILRSDLTLPIARLVATRMHADESPVRLRYAAPIVRDTTVFMGKSRQVTQLGIELIGQSGKKADVEVLSLLAESLNAAGLAGWRIVCGDVKLARAALDAAGIYGEDRTEVLRFIHRSDLVGLDVFLETLGISENARRAVSQLMRVSGDAAALDEATAILESIGADTTGIEELQVGFDAARELGFSDALSMDLSVLNSFDYYTGLVFEAHAPGLSAPLASGGRYDGVLAQWGVDAPAAGFSISLDGLEEAIGACVEDRPLRIAVPKGSLFEESVNVLESVGFDVSELRNPGRHLIIRTDDVEYIIVRASDAPAFVATGGADCGICGRDSLIEANLDVVQLVDLGYGTCRFVVAEPAEAKGAADAAYARRGTVRVATKYPRITQRYYDRIGKQVDIITLHGNIELGPVVGLSDRIVDITATGTTLRENNLVIVDDVMECSARFFANPVRVRCDARIRELARKLAALEGAE